MTRFLTRTSRFSSFSRLALIASLALGTGLAIFVPLTTPPVRAAEESKKPVTLAPWTTDDVILVERYGSVAVAPDGKAMVYVKSLPNTETQGRTSNLFLVRFDGKENVTTQLTRGKSGASSPRWSPDGTKVAFMTGRENPDSKKAKGAQVWIFDLKAGGEPYAVTSEERSVQGYDWAGKDTLLPGQKQAEEDNQENTQQPVGQHLAGAGGT
jgi:dipeptidyl aminopeptidase/acylaminoacyl peptidase